MSNILSSFLGLAKNNDGFFKSEKQAKFLLARTDGGVYAINQVLTFGEYDGRTKRNTAEISWTVYCDAQGVTKIEKYTAKQGLSVYWERTPEFIKVAADRKAKERKALVEFAADRIATYAEAIEEAKDTYDLVMSEKMQVLKPEKVKALQAKYKNALNSLMAEYQEWVKSIGADLVAEAIQS